MNARPLIFACVLTLTASAGFAVHNAAAQSDAAPDAAITVEMVKPGLAVLFGRGGNVAVAFGADGTVLVDDKFADLTPDIQAAIKGLGADPVSYLVNTHWHGDHSGGNANFGGAGALIMAQDNVRTRLAEGNVASGGNSKPAPVAALPVITYAQGVKLHVNGGAMQLVHLPSGHTNGDSAVWWPDANVVHMGDQFFHEVTLPYIDLTSGGNALGVLAGTERMLAMIDDETVVIPGHGPLTDKAGLTEYRDMLRDVIAKVEAAKAGGATLEQVKAMPIADPYDKGPESFITPDAFEEAVYRSLDLRDLAG